MRPYVFLCFPQFFKKVAQDYPSTYFWRPTRHRPHLPRRFLNSWFPSCCKYVLAVFSTPLLANLRSILQNFCRPTMLHLSVQLIAHPIFIYIYPCGSHATLARRFLTASTSSGRQKVGPNLYDTKQQFFDGKMKGRLRSIISHVQRDEDFLRPRLVYCLCHLHTYIQIAVARCRYIFTVSVTSNFFVYGWLWACRST